MSLESRITEVVQAIGADIKTLQDTVTGGGGAQQVFVQDTAPNFLGGVGMWWQTGVGGGSDMTLWVEDGV